MKYFKLLLSLGLLATFKLQAQDPQYTQIHNNPLYLNPALAGATGDGRMSANYRYQWPGLDVSYTSFSASYDQFIPKFNSGIGILMNRDQTSVKNQFSMIDIDKADRNPGAAKPITVTTLAGFYSYLAPLTDRLYFQAGLSAGVHVRQVSNSFIFEQDLLGSPNSELLSSLSPNNFLDFSGGGMLYSNDFWVGVSGFHLNQPNQSLLEGIGGVDKLPAKLTLTGGYRFDLAKLKKGVYIDKDISITYAFLYRMQGKSDQLDMGLYLNYEPITFGVWYRGVPLKAFSASGDSPSSAPTTFRSNDAISLMLGLKKSQFSFVYSYDITISSLGWASTAGSHEISITYNLATNLDYAKSRPRYGRFGRIYCPSPFKKYQRLK